MSNPSGEFVDETLIVMALALTLEVLPLAPYPEAMREKMKARILALIERIQSKQYQTETVTTYDAYGNPHTP